MKCLLDSVSGKVAQYEQCLLKKDFKVSKTEFGDFYIEIESLNDVIDLIYVVGHDVVVRHPDWYGRSEYIPYIEIRDNI